MPRRALTFGALFCISILINSDLLKELLDFSLDNDFSTHILLIPFISAFLVFRERASIFGDKTPPSLHGILPIIIGIFLAMAWMTQNISVRVLGMVLVWIGIFLFLFGKGGFRKALFPLLFLVFMIPIPEVLLQHIIALLQRGSAEASNIIFNMTGTPVYREGTFFSLPGINIDIAPQCSSIRSSLALLITSLLAAYLMLESGWRRVLFVAVSVPMAMVKNALRIVTLSLLAVHVDKGWLTDSDLHKEGGILFFILALLLMFPLLWILRRSELKSGKNNAVYLKTK